MMLKKFTAVACVAAASFGLAPAVAEASPPVTGAGTYAVTGFVQNSSKTIGSYTYANQTISLANSGVLDGPSSAVVNCLFAPNGDGWCAGTEHFEGSIGGRTGTAEFVVAYSVTGGQFNGSLAVLSGTAGLTGLTGTGTFQGGFTGTNSLTYHLSH